MQFRWLSSNILQFTFDVGGVNNVNMQRTWSPSANTWYHIALDRNGSNWYMFIDGVQLAAAYSASNTFNNATGQLNVGAGYSPVGDFLNGWLDEFRISKGIARWTANFTPPTVAYGTTVALDTSVKKFGAGSALFYGSGGYLYTADHADWNFGTGDFTIDFWVNFTSLTLKQGFIGQYQNSSNYWILGKNADNTLYIFRYGGSQVAYYVTIAAPSFLPALGITWNL